MKVSALIADDERLARNGLRAMLDEVDWITVTGEAANGPACVQLIDSLKPDLVFLDIEMPGIHGTDVMRQMTHQPYVVFTTAYAQHAVTGFELGALDYLLKPFGKERLARCLERVRSAIGEPIATSPLGRFGEAMSTGAMSRLFVRSGGGVIPVDVRTVSRFDADGDYVTAHAAKSRYMLHLSLNRLETRLDARRFVRVHRTAIVNLDHVAAFRARGGKLIAEMNDGAVVAVSRERAKELRHFAV